MGEEETAETCVVRTRLFDDQNKYEDLPSWSSVSPVEIAVLPKVTLKRASGSKVSSNWGVSSASTNDIVSRQPQ